MGEGALDDDLVDADSSTRRCEFLSPRGAGDSVDRADDTGKAEWRQHQKRPFVLALFTDRRTIRGIVGMPTLTPDASSACNRIAGLKSQRSRRANLRRKRNAPDRGTVR